MSDQFSPEEVARLKQLAAKPVRKTHVLQVLDRSSSMSTGKEITISTYNEQLDVMKQAQKKDGGEVTVSLVMFSYGAELVYKAKALDQVETLNLENYIPGGMTALYDAIGLAIETAQSLDASGDTAFLLQILTDGEENQSKIYTAEKLKSMIEELSATGKWTVTVSGPKGQVDVFAKNVSIPLGNTTGFDPHSLLSRASNKGIMVEAQAQYFASRAMGMTSVETAYSSVVKDLSDQDLKPTVASDKRPTA
jgi:hypothetical protein